MFELHFVIRTICATSACAKHPEIGKIASFIAMDESSASSSSVWKHLEKNKGAVTVTHRLCQETLKWNGSMTSSLWNHIKGQHASACK